MKRTIIKTGSCIACGTKHLQRAYPSVGDYEYGTYRDVNYVRCARCGLLLQQPLPPTERIDSFYPSSYRNHRQFSKRSFYWLLKNYQVNNLARDIDHLSENKSDTILEIGCGSGSLLISLQKRGLYQVWGSDISDAGQHALSRMKIQFRKSNIEKSFPYHKKFELLILNHVIEHLLDPVSVLSACREHLSERGKIIIITPNSDSILAHFFGKFSDGINAPRHICIFSPRSMEYLRKKLNFGKLIFYPVLDPMQWALSVQNVFQNIPFLQTRLIRGLAWYTVFLSIVFSPISLFTVFGKKSASMMCVLV